MADAPGVWTTKSTDVFTINVARANVEAACLQAGNDTKGWRVAESGSDRILVKSNPGVIDMRPYSVEILLGDAQDGATTLTLNGWSFGKGPGLKKMVGRAVGTVRTAIESHAQ